MKSTYKAWHFPSIQNNSHVDCFICLCERSHKILKHFKQNILHDITPIKNKCAEPWRLTFLCFFGLLLKLVESHHQLLFLPLHLLFLSLNGLSSLFLTLQLSSADKTQPERHTVTFAQDTALYPQTKVISQTNLPRKIY